MVDGARKGRLDSDLKRARRERGYSREGRSILTLEDGYAYWDGKACEPE